MENKDELLDNHNWKKTNKRYLFELQKFLDLLDNIKDDKLKMEIVYQFVQYDKTVTELAEDMIYDGKKNLETK